MPATESLERLTLYRPGQEPLSDGGLLELVPDFQLDSATATLFGGDRLWEYDLSFTETDRKLIAVEYADFGGAILGQHPIEVDIEQGSRSVAIAYALLESGLTGRALTVDEVLDEQVGEYQREIDEGLGIL